jgi:hypothetical protein
LCALIQEQPVQDRAGLLIGDAGHRLGAKAALERPDRRRQIIDGIAVTGQRGGDGGIAPLRIDQPVARPPVL